MKKDSNAIIKMALVIVIAALALSAIVYFMMKADNNSSAVAIIDIMAEKENTESSVEELPAFADINNYEFNTAKIYASHPVNCTYVDNEFAELEKELDVEKTGFLTYDYNGFRLQAIENKYNWEKEDLLEIMKEADCGSSLFYGTTKDNEYLIFGRCLGTSSLGSSEEDYEYLVGDCFMVEKEIYDYFGRPVIGRELASALQGDYDFLYYDYYSYIPGNTINIDICEENGFTRELAYANETDVASLAVRSHYEEEYNLTLKIMPNSKWTKSEAEEMINEATCGIGDSFLGTIGEGDAYLLFASHCPAAFNTKEERDNNLCPERLEEVKEILNR